MHDVSVVDELGRGVRKVASPDALRCAGFNQHIVSAEDERDRPSGVYNSIRTCPHFCGRGG